MPNRFLYRDNSGIGHKSVFEGDLKLIDVVKFSKLGYYYLKTFWEGIKFPIAISVDVTYKCNLACKHCYFIKQNYERELDCGEYIRLLKGLKHKYPGILHATWVGGEPLLRRKLVEEGMKLFNFNMVVTNGTIELPKWKNCVFNVSVDGTKDYYTEIRGSDCYDLVKRNSDRDDVHVNIACVLNKLNHYCIEDLVKEWEKTKVRGIVFDFYTPVEGAADELWLNWEERDILVQKILNLKKRYGSFILNSAPVLNMMKSGKSKEITRDCPLPQIIMCLDPLGKRKLPCVIGGMADCSRCGCIIPFQSYLLFHEKDLRTFFVTKRIFT